MDFSHFPSSLVEIQQKISQICEAANSSQDRWTFHVAETSALTAGSVRVGGPETVDTNLLLGVTRNGKSKENDTQLCTFYLGYSTWEGRVIFLDHTESSSDVDKIMWTRFLARVGKALHCRRLVWRHTDLLPSYGPYSPEALDDWLTLNWNLPEMKACVDYIERDEGTADSLSLRQVFSKVLDQQTPHNTFRLRLATKSDVETIDRLIMGLAEFEKEPESYILSKEQLRHDGFAGHPFYYCILVDDCSGNLAHSCGMAFCWVGCHCNTGRFLFLEDLFFEEKYRGQGGGKLIMSTLATVAQQLGCSKAVWQALDWNTPAM